MDRRRPDCPRSGRYASKFGIKVRNSRSIARLRPRRAQLSLPGVDHSVELPPRDRRRKRNGASRVPRTSRPIASIQHASLAPVIRRRPRKNSGQISARGHSRSSRTPLTDYTRPFRINRASGNLFPVAGQLHVGHLSYCIENPSYPP